MIRKATLKDIDSIIDITKACAKYMISRNIFQWNVHYPSRTPFETDVKRDELYVLESGKIIHRVYVKYNGIFNIHDKNTWQGAYEFFNEAMHQFEEFYEDFEDFIKRAIY